MDEDGNRDEAGVFRGSSIYQKPEADVPIDWMPVSTEEAMHTLSEATRVIPEHQIRCLRRKIEAIAARKRSMEAIAARKRSMDVDASCADVKKQREA